MAVACFWIFRGVLDTTLKVSTPEFWCMTQIAILSGFVTSHPVNS